MQARSDASIVTFIAWLNEQQSDADKFLLERIGDTGIFVKRDKAEWVQEQVRGYIASLVFEDEPDLPILDTAK